MRSTAPSTAEDATLRAHAEELRRDVFWAHAISNVAGLAVIGLAALAWKTGSGAWFAVYLVASVLLAVTISRASSYTRSRQHARDLRWAERLHELATRDELTGLYNRRHFNTVLEHWIASAPQGAGGVLLAIVDLDGLKSINDSLGHAAGDTAIRMTAEAICSAAPHGAIVARMGGDEFAVLAAANDLADGELKERISLAVRTAPFASGNGAQPPLGASVGLARWQPGFGGDELFRAADADLYADKALRGGPATRAA